MRFPTAFAAAIVATTVTSIAWAEIWPTLEEYARDCVLIVRVKQVGDYSDQDYAPLTLEVIETWVGQFDPGEFVHTRKGLIVARFGQHGMTLKPGQEAIVFYSRRNQPPDRIASHSTAFPITDEKVVYGTTSNEGPQTFTVSEFRRRIEEARK